LIEHLQSIVKSITLSIDQFAMVALFASLIIYLYAFLGYESFQEDFYLTGVGVDFHGENVCQSLKQCFFTTLNFVSLIDRRDLARQEESATS
jgi:hypothetical protein